MDQSAAPSSPRRPSPPVPRLGRATPARVRVGEARPEGAKGFVLLPRRWVVERSLAWWLHARRNARDYETRPEHSEAMLTLAAITLMTRRLTRLTPYPTAATPRPTTAVQAA
ncbi:hypothetical protein Sipo8835_15400 [Streptomyces ipomoeae]|uniref:Transposase IS4-like domain-containing protein n=1 Tax=Streptomyces ipomoeae TaxID=103232 RepID=A0AAE8W2K2_9ACTN|nr:hypothetical protein Sipo8835_15400 [Streptomyces ipomoeae]